MSSGYLLEQIEALYKALSFPPLDLKRIKNNNAYSYVPGPVTTDCFTY